MRVEHAIAGVKICRIAKDQFRNTAEGLSDTVMEIACGLHNTCTDRRCGVCADSGAPDAIATPLLIFDRVYSINHTLHHENLHVFSTRHL